MSDEVITIQGANLHCRENMCPMHCKHTEAQLTELANKYKAAAMEAAYLHKLAAIFDAFTHCEDDVWKMLSSEYPNLFKWWQKTSGTCEENTALLETDITP